MVEDNNLQQCEDIHDNGNGDSEDDDYTLIVSPDSDLEEHNEQQEHGEGEDNLASLAGLEPDEEDLLVEEGARLDLDSDEEQEGRDLASSPISRTAVVAGGVGLLVFFVVGAISLFTGSGGEQQIGERNQRQEDTAQSDSYSKSDRYKSKLALVGQEKGQQEVQQQPQTTPVREQQQQGEGGGEQRTQQQSQQQQEEQGGRLYNPPPQQPQSQPQPPLPSGATEPNPAEPQRVRQRPPQPQRQRLQPQQQEQEEQIDPLSRWSKLASAGSRGGQFSRVQPVETLEQRQGNGRQAASNQVAAQIPSPELQNGGRIMQVMPDEQQDSRASASAQGRQRQNQPSRRQVEGFPEATIGDDPVYDNENQEQQNDRRQVQPQPMQPMNDNWNDRSSYPHTQDTQGQRQQSRDFNGGNNDRVLTPLPATKQASRQHQRTPGEQGILQRQRQRSSEDNDQQQSHQQAVMRVAIGTSARAKVSTPIVASTSGKTVGRFAVELTRPLQSTDGKVALPAGSILITDVLAIDDNSRAIQQTVVAVVYPDRDGEIRQEIIERNTLLVRGSDGGALIASLEGGAAEAGSIEDVRAGAVGALENVGEVANQADVFSTSSASSGGDDSSTVTTTTVERDDNSLAAAALEGFFGEVGDRLEERSEDRLQSAPVLEVESGEEVVVFVNGFLEVRR